VIDCSIENIEGSSKALSLRAPFVRRVFGGNRGREDFITKHVSNLNSKQCFLFIFLRNFLSGVCYCFFFELTRAIDENAQFYANEFIIRDIRSSNYSNDSGLFVYLA